MIITPQSPRNIVSPREGKQHDSQAPIEVGTSAFDDALREVRETVAQTELGEWPSEFLLKGNPSKLQDGGPPELLKKKLRLHSRNPKRLALAVSMDKPWHLGEFLLDELLAQGVKYREDRPHVQFCDPEYSYCAVMKEMMTQTHAALNRIFDIKYFWKYLRPEDHDGVPGCLYTVDNLGAPGHYSYGAGHAAAAAATAMVLYRNLDLTPEQWQMVLDACWKFGAGRTLLGVHFLQDNAEGFRVGLQY